MEQQTIPLEKFNMSEAEIIKKIAKKIHMPFIETDEIQINISPSQYISEEIARKNHIIPVEEIHGELFVAVADPTQFQLLEDISIRVKMSVKPMLATKQAIKSAIQKHYSDTEKTLEAVSDFSKEQEMIEIHTDEIDVDVENAPIVRIVNTIISESLNLFASDIHIEPFEKIIRVRVRVDGDLQELIELPKATLAGVVTRIKIISNLNIAESKRPQDGRVGLSFKDKKINIRISILPTVFGEKIVIRILNSSDNILDKSQIGLSKTNFDRLETIMKVSEGIILLTGPTGSGKTTTLYSILKDYNEIDKNIITLEDPVEYQVYGINQVQVNSEIGMTFASGLRSVLRQDPDVIMLGEIRDEETAQIAIRSAVTGHIVLSTLHTNDTASSIARLIDMGIPKYMVNSAVVGVVAQRLLKRICPKCKEEYLADKNEKDNLNMSGEVKLYRGRGCANCNNTGYKGRAGIHEILLMDQDVKMLISQGGSTEEIKLKAKENGMQTLEESALELVLNGTTTIQEMIKTTFAID